MTRDDLLLDRRDLIRHCLALLRKLPTSRLHLEVDASTRTIAVTTQGLDRLDVLLDGHPGSTHEISDGRPIDMTYPGGVGRVELIGFAGDEVRQRRRLAI